MNMAAARNERINERLRHPNRATFAQDEEGLNKVYAYTSAPGVYDDPTMLQTLHP